jgi:hypothetical protein
MYIEYCLNRRFYVVGYRLFQVCRLDGVHPAFQTDDYNRVVILLVDLTSVERYTADVLMASSFVRSDESAFALEYSKKSSLKHTCILQQSNYLA